MLRLNIAVFIVVIFVTVQVPDLNTILKLYNNVGMFLIRIEEKKTF